MQVEPAVLNIFLGALRVCSVACRKQHYSLLALHAGAASLLMQLQVAAAAASVGGSLAAVKGSLGSWGTYFKGQADKVGENVIARTGSPGITGRATSQTSSSPSGPAGSSAQA